MAGLFILISCPVMAVPILNTDASGQLIGAENIEVNGALYNVEFKDGTFNDIFGGTSGLDATTFSDGRRFALAFDTQVFSGIFDTDPTRTLGCSSSVTCRIYTPYFVENGDVFSIVAANGPTVSTTDSVFSFVFDNPLNQDFSLDPIAVYADWSLADVGGGTGPATIPAPSTFLLFSTTLLGLAVGRRKQAASLKKNSSPKPFC